ncbi:S4 domain-containing protein YaaA [Kroppenstedtia pulmonis]|uniref:S4 domain-containing protein YaaA n=1 Tax=Kroppenstedtia pulmonis TaxID=1380685 RepID=A0A7D3XPW5_9BACL|nr:S4 domain-containing protein YaaA [Kroppenstedtia pulmonis]QKG83008.1 S4 domain-containing protein YaaA [Kroppenstedtia pulmonis]
MESVSIHSEYITLGQLLKKLNLLGTGGQVKHFLSENRVTVNGEPEMRRGRKIYPQDCVDIPGFGSVYLTRE